MLVTVAQLNAIATSKPDPANVKSIVQSLSAYGKQAGLDQPHRLAHFLAQLAHESGGFRYDREVWGPTPAQARYDTRTDLGNTPARDGDGFKNRGRGPIQVTGGYNIARFEEWCRGQGYSPPDFTGNPDLINTDPWEGLSAIWYWQAGNPTGKSLNALADKNDLEMVTRRINGGTNGLADRMAYYTRAGLVLLGFKPTDVKLLQIEAQKRGHLPAGVGQIDGIDGPKTRAAIHMMLAEKASSSAASADVKQAPVTSVELEPVVPKGAENRQGIWTWGGAGLLAGMGQAFAPLMGLPWQAQIALAVIGIGAVVFFLVKGELIVRRVKTILQEIG